MTFASHKALRFGIVGLTAASIAFAAPGYAQKKKPVPAVAPAPVAPVAPAAPPAPPSLADTLTGDAKADYVSGKLLYGDGDYRGALVKFKGAYDKSKDVRLLWNVAACEKNLRHYANVLRLLRQYQKDGAAVLTQSDRDEASELLKTIEPLTASLKLTVNEPGAEIFLDDALIGQSPLDAPITVDIGMRKLRVRKTDYKEIAKDVPVGGNPEITLDIQLEKIIHEGRLAVTAGPHDSIAIDGKTIAAGSWSGTLSSGGHMLRITAPEMRPYQSDVVISDNETRTLSITLDKDVKAGGGIPAWVWIGGGALVVSGLAIGSYALFKPADKPATLPEGTLQPGSVQAAYPSIHFH